MRILFAQQREDLFAGMFAGASICLCRSTAWHAHDDAAKYCRERCCYRRIVAMTFRSETPDQASGGSSCVELRCSCFADESFCVGCSAAYGPGGPFRAVLERHHPCGIERRLRAHRPQLLRQHRCHGRSHDPRHVRGHLIFWKEKDQPGFTVSGILKDLSYTTSPPCKKRIMCTVVISVMSEDQLRAT